MTEIVIDCSVSATWVLPGELSARAERLLAQVLDGEIRLFVRKLEPASQCSATQAYHRA
jgi:hypothetical protein